MTNKTFLKLGRVVFIILSTYFLVLPVLSVLFLLPLTCGTDTSEFCGIWIFIAFPHLGLIFGFDEFISVEPYIVFAIGVFSFAFTVSVKYLVKRCKKYDIGYCWTLISTFILVIIFTVVVNFTLYPISAKDWPSWSEEAVVQNDPQICIEKVTDYSKVDCLESAAIKSGKISFCADIKNIADGGQYYTDSCITQVKIVENFSKKYCNNTYDYNCFYDYCTNSNNNYCSTAILNGFSNNYIEELAGQLMDTGWCDLYKGSPNDTENISSCYARVFIIKAENTHEASWCDQINADYAWSDSFKKQCCEYASCGT